jgi:hypothetical protein
MDERYLAPSDLSFLSRLLDRDEMWDALRDFDALMKGAETRVRSADSSAESVKAANLLTCSPISLQS